MIRKTAYAKVNLCLEVLGRRTDGYHEIATILQTVSLADEMSFSAAEDVSLGCDDATLANEDNLAYRAARLLQNATGTQQGVRIEIQKRIPSGAGLGGGSSDAAEALKALNLLWGTELSNRELEALGAELGSDVPFFIRGGTALAEGRGERLNPLPNLVATWLVLLVPPTRIPEKTRMVFSLLRPAHFSNGDSASAQAKALAGESLRPDALEMFNCFDAVVDAAFGDLGSYRRAMATASGGAGHLSGAGPTLFRLLASEAEARSIAAHLGSASDGTAIVCSTIGGVGDTRNA